MTTRVFWKALILSLNGTRRYIQRNQLGLEDSLTAPQYACVVAVLDAILTCLAALPVNTPDE